MHKGDSTPDYRVIMESFSAYVDAERPTVTSPGDAADLLRPVLAGREQEECHVLLLNVRNRVVGHEIITVGLVDRSQLHAREVFRPAIRANCSRIVVIHNHPSGDTTPSPEDIHVTRSLAEAGKIIGIELLDHVIIGRRRPGRVKDWQSLREEGLMG